MEFKDRLKECRKEHRLSQNELAEKTGLTIRTIQNYENGSRRPQNIDIVCRMAAALGTTAEDLLDGESLIITDAYEKGGAKTAREIEKLVSEISGLFAGGEIDEEEKEGVMAAISQAYWIAKANNRKYGHKPEEGGKESE